MTRDIALAFAHPEDRARAMSPEPVPDRISLRDHIVSVDIGAFQPERGHPQRLAFNVVVEVRDAGSVGDDQGGYAVVFATPAPMRDRLAQADTMSMDGTFFITPKPFKQVG